MRLSSFSALFVVFESLALAYPYNEVNNNAISAAVQAHLLQARSGCPTVDEIRMWLRKNTQIGENTIFYIKPVTKADARFFAEQINGHFRGNLIDQEVYLDWVGACKEGKDQDLVTPRVSEAIALEAKRTAYVLMTTTPDPKSIWMKYEYPALKHNGVAVMKLRPGGKPVPYSSGSPPPSRSPSPELGNRSPSPGSGKGLPKRAGHKRGRASQGKSFMQSFQRMQDNLSTRIRLAFPFPNSN